MILVDRWAKEHTVVGLLELGLVRKVRHSDCCRVSGCVEENEVRIGWMKPGKQKKEFIWPGHGNPADKGSLHGIIASCNAYWPPANQTPPMVGAGQRLIPSFEVTVLLSAEDPGCSPPPTRISRAELCQARGVEYGTPIHLITILECSIF